MLDLRKSDAFTDFFVIATGANQRQVHAIADGVEMALKAAGVRPSNVEGLEEGRVGPPRLLRLRRARLLAGGAGLLRSRAPLGLRPPHSVRRRSRRSLTARPEPGDEQLARVDRPRAVGARRAGVRLVLRHHSTAARAARCATPAGRGSLDLLRQSATAAVSRCRPGGAPRSIWALSHAAGGAARQSAGTPRWARTLACSATSFTR